MPCCEDWAWPCGKEPRPELGPDMPSSLLTRRARASAAGLDAQGSQIGEQPLEVEGRQRGVCILGGLLQAGGDRRSAYKPDLGAGGAKTLGISGRTPDSRGLFGFLGPQRPPCPSPALRREVTYRKWSCLCLDCPASWRPEGLECFRVRAKPAPSSLSCVGGREPPGGTRKVSVRGCP